MTMTMMMIIIIICLFQTKKNSLNAKKTTTKKHLQVTYHDAVAPHRPTTDLLFLAVVEEPGSHVLHGSGAGHPKTHLPQK